MFPRSLAAEENRMDAHGADGLRATFTAFHHAVFQMLCSSQTNCLGLISEKSCKSVAGGLCMYPPPREVSSGDRATLPQIQVGGHKMKGKKP
ncbi:unnamed protein product [Rangifer tarandus platyrhynchus]|uniref:Uncharacterized protein n=1 Tax=Rangifer tarandus platyrhynchus TaxID=3082113 RepID=A0AC59YA70_RANTA